MPADPAVSEPAHEFPGRATTLPRVAEPATGGPFKMKYIRHKKLGFVLFEGSVRHDDVARSLGGLDQVVSAGFVFAPSADFRCLGHSATLNLSADANDSTELHSRIKVF